VIASAFAACRSEGRAAFVPYVTAGYPGPGDTVALLEGLADAGADVLELGIPFSDPLADGPTIQRSSFVSLGNGTTTGRVLKDLREFRSRRETPVVVFTYLNPVLRFGFDRFLQEAADAGANGILLTDLPTGADPPLEAEVVRSSLDLIRLVAPTTAVSRIPAVARGGSGFLYAISRTGVTGARSELPTELRRKVEAIRAAVELPVAVGFGISTPEQAGAVGTLADGVVVGSALVERLGSDGLDAGFEFAASLRGALSASIGVTRRPAPST